MIKKKNSFDVIMLSFPVQANFIDWIGFALLWNSIFQIYTELIYLGSLYHMVLLLGFGGSDYRDTYITIVLLASVTPVGGAAELE